jgi:shikimate kinase
MRLLSASRKIWLWADMEVLQERRLLGGQASSEHRVQGEGLGEILLERRNKYASAADIVVNAEQSLEDLVKTLEDEVRQTL